jgi:hypothetical protein
MTERTLIALGLAVAVESAHWLRLRWNFDQHALIRAWQLSILSAGATAVFLWIDGDRITVLHRIIGWLPALFLPMQFVQAFGLRDSMPLSTFSFFARQRHLRNERLGLRDTTATVNFGNIYFAVCLVGATLGPKATSVFFLPGLLILLAWLLLASRQTRWLPLSFAIGIVACGAVAGQSFLTSLFERTMRYHRGGERGLRDPNATETAIGFLGEIKQSPEIQWRISLEKGKPIPTHLRSANFNRYSSGKWRNSEGIGLGSRADFLTLDEKPEGSDYYVFRSNEEQPPPSPSLPYFELRGSVEPDAQLPVPGNTASIRGFALDSVLHNSLGTIRITPKNSVIRGIVTWQDSVQLEEPPLKDDMTIPDGEKKAVRAVAEELGLAALPTIEAKTRALSQWFSKEFKYQRYLTIQPVRTRGEPSAISEFLTRNRNGHCEYFATAASLLLRAANVPTRYSIGYVVREKTDKGYVIRGTDAHSWVRVWDESASTWIDFDPTPGTWFSLEPNRQSSYQWLSDAYLGIREDFGLWRTDPQNRTGLGIGMATMGVLLMSFVGYRLWRSKKVISHSGKPHVIRTPSVRTPLHELEPIARRLLGPRPIGIPLSKWLLQLAPRFEDPTQLEKAIIIHQQLRYDPAPPDVSVDPLREIVEGLKTHLKSTI